MIRIKHVQVLISTFQIFFCFNSLQLRFENSFRASSQKRNSREETKRIETSASENLKIYHVSG